MSEPSDHQPKVLVTEGPYIVSGGVPIVRRRKVVSENGEPITWQTTEHLPTQEEAYLCRCGGSSTKPFCDDTHLSNGFDGPQTASTQPYAERAKPMDGGGVVVRDDRSLCAHAGFCSNKATNVWKIAKGQGATDSVARSAMIAMIEHCPSGALSFRLTESTPDVEPALAVMVGVVDDGPLLITGGIPVTREDGTTDGVRNRVALCRCGRSANKPYCDGTHATVGFVDS
jgi:CDGSH-type Zn-finger protein